MARSCVTIVCDECDTRATITARNVDYVQYCPFCAGLVPNPIDASRDDDDDDEGDDELDELDDEDVEDFTDDE